MPPTAPPPPSPESPLHTQTALRLLTAVVRASFDASADVLQLARQFNIFGQMRQRESIDATCSEFAEKLLAYRGTILPGFFEELYQRAPTSSWARIRELTLQIARFDLPVQAPSREGAERLAELRIDLDAPELTMKEGELLLTRIEAIFGVPKIRTYRFEQREHGVHVHLSLPASAARALRRRGARQLSRDTRRPVWRIVETGSPFVLAWTMGSWWLRERGWIVLFLATPAAVAATLITRPPAPTTSLTDCLTTLDLRRVQVERDTVLAERKALPRAPTCPTPDPTPPPITTTDPALAQCQQTLRASVPRAECQAAIDAAQAPIKAELTSCQTSQSALLLQCQSTTETLTDCETEQALDEAALTKCQADLAALQATIAKLIATERCPLPGGWTSKKGALNDAPACSDGVCTAELDSGDRLRWRDTAQVFGPPGPPQPKVLRQGLRVCAEGILDKADKFQTHRLVALQR